MITRKAMGAEREVECGHLRKAWVFEDDQT